MKLKKLSRSHIRWMAKWKGNALTPDTLQGNIEGFATKRECQEFIKQQYGYIATRWDLRRAPHHWRVPKAVKVWIRATEL